MDEALLLIEKSEAPSKGEEGKAIDHADIELFAKEADVDEEVEFDWIIQNTD